MTVALVVNGRRYLGWRSVSVTRTIQAAAGSFAIGISDKWTGQKVAWPIVEEDECSVEIDDETVLTGWVGQRSQSITATARSFNVSGKDKAGALVENSALLDRWSFRNATALDVARAVAAPFGVVVRLESGVTLPPPLRKVSINPGETAYDVVQRVAETTGLLVVSDGEGGLRLTRAGTSRASAIVEGQNVLTAAVNYNAAERFATYVVLGSSPGNDESSAGALRIRGRATDAGVRRSDRVQVVRPQRGLTRAQATSFADWTARQRAAAAEELSVSVRGWRQSNGELWPVNSRAAVRIGSLGIEGDMLIASVTYALADRGEIANLSLVRPDAYEPNPAARVLNAEFKSDG